MSIYLIGRLAREHLSNHVNYSMSTYVIGRLTCQRFAVVCGGGDSPLSVRHSIVEYRVEHSINIVEYGVDHNDER